MHPANRLALWFWVASLLPLLERQFLYLATGTLLLLALRFAKNRFFKALPRIRWILLALGVVYGWTTPGEYLWPSHLSPTHEGLFLGLEQMVRLLGLITSLQILLATMSRPEIFAGLHVLAKPINYLGLSRDRIALRLSLALEMTEALFEKKQPIKQLMHELHTPMHSHALQQVVLPVLPMSIWQHILLLFILGMIIGILALAGASKWL